MAGKICVPLDGTEYAEQVIPLIAEIASRAGISVLLVSVIDPGELGVTLTAGEGVPLPSDYSTTGAAGMRVAGTGTGGTTGMVWIPPIGSLQELSEGEAKAIKEVTSRADSYLAGIKQRLADRGIDVSSVLGFGDAENEIVNEAVKAGATMIAMTGRSKSFWERGALGSTADRVLSASPVPVLVFKPMEGLAEEVSVTPKTVVVGLDGSKQAEQGLKPAVDLAKTVGARLVLVRVVRRDSAARREEAAKYLEAVASSAGLQAERLVRSGYEAEEVIMAADACDDPVIAVTEHGGRSFGRWFRGSTTDKIIRNAGYPVLVSPVTED